MKSSQNRVIRLIAIFKLIKAATLIVAGIAALRLIHADAAATLEHWVLRLGLSPGRPFVDHAIEKLGSISPNKIRDAGLGSFLYAALFLTEGIGLWLRKRWAEWFTTIITASLLPLELYEIQRHPTFAKVLVFLLNGAIVAYLILRLRSENDRDENLLPLPTKHTP